MAFVKGVFKVFKETIEHEEIVAKGVRLLWEEAHRPPHGKRATCSGNLFSLY